MGIDKDVLRGPSESELSIVFGKFHKFLEEEIFVPEISPIAYTQALAVLVRINEEEGSKRLGESVFHEFWKNCEAMAHNFSRHTDLTKDWSKLE